MHFQCYCPHFWKIRSLRKTSSSIMRPSSPLLCALPTSCKAHLLFSPRSTPEPCLWDLPPASLICRQRQRQTGMQGNMRQTLSLPWFLPLPLFPPVLRNPSPAGTERSFHASVPLHKLFKTKALPPTVSTSEAPTVCKTAWVSPPLQSLPPSQ